MKFQPAPLTALVATNPCYPQVHLSEVRESHSGQYECRPSNCHGTNNTAVTLVVLDGESVLARQQLREIRTVNMQCIEEGCAAKNRDCQWQFYRVFRICCWECPQLCLLQNGYKYRGCWGGEISLTVVYFNVFARSRILFTNIVTTGFSKFKFSPKEQHK